MQTRESWILTTLAVLEVALSAATFHDTHMKQYQCPHMGLPTTSQLMDS